VVSEPRKLGLNFDLLTLDNRKVVLRNEKVEGDLGEEGLERLKDDDLGVFGFGLLLLLLLY
jgi:hypothetical protein